LGEVIREFLEAYGLDDKWREKKALHAWKILFGGLVAHHTTDLYIRNRVLYIKLDSPSLRHELNYAREKIVKAVNEEAGIPIIDDVVVN